MSSRDLAAGIMFLLQTVVGILGNFFLLSYYLLLYYKEYAFKPTDLILTHLIIANSLIILSQGVPNTMAAFQLTQSFSYIGCNMLFYIQRVGRSVSIGTTCLLSVFQAITISPSNSCWKDLKVKVHRYISLSIFLCWIFYLAINIIFPVYVYSKQNSKNMTKKGREAVYCFSGGHDATTKSLYVALLVYPEVLLSGLIFWSSCSMIVILCRHRQRVQHMRSTHSSSRASPETKATQNILALVSTFLVFYTFSAILHACIALLHNPNWWLVNFTVLISLCFPSFGPFVLMARDSALSSLCFVWLRNLKSNHISDM